MVRGRLRFALSRLGRRAQVSAYGSMASSADDPMRVSCGWASLRGVAVDHSPSEGVVEPGGASRAGLLQSHIPEFHPAGCARTESKTKSMSAGEAQGRESKVYAEHQASAAPSFTTL